MFTAVPFTDDDPGSRLAWIRDHLVALERLPLPGGGRTIERLCGLVELGALDGSLARLAEGHLDAVAILAELGQPCRGVGLRGVWAARPELLHAELVKGRWHLSGVKPWASGAGGIDRALVTATVAGGDVLLFDVDVRAVHFDDDWHPIGMRASDSRTALIDVVADDPVGPAGSYTSRPGFWHGGVGVAACWHGLARRIVHDLDRWSRDRSDVTAALAAGKANALLAASASLLVATGRLIDDRPNDVCGGRGWAYTARTAVEHGSREILSISTAMQGAASLCFESDHARAVADLTVYLAQFHQHKDPAEVPHGGDRAWWT
jgi:alkylation response protein AidB-like acyl-CoA dehydrogenase